MAGRKRAIMALADTLLIDLGTHARRSSVIAYLDDNKNTVAALADMDMTEARYIIGLGYMRRMNVQSLLAVPQVAGLRVTTASKLKLERLYRKELRSFLGSSPSLGQDLA